MSVADTPMPGKDEGTPPNEVDRHEHDPASEESVQGNAQPEPDSSLPPVEYDLEVEVEDAERQPT